MNPTRNARREGQEESLQYRTHQETLGQEEMIEEKLAQLRSFIEQLKKTSAGATELEWRTKLFGACNQIADETSSQFYGRLRHWMDRDLPQTKSPLHAPRQTDCGDSCD